MKSRHPQQNRPQNDLFSDSKNTCLQASALQQERECSGMNCFRYWATAAWPLLAAKQRGVLEREVRARRFASALTRALTISRFPKAAAVCKGVYEMEFGISISSLLT